MRRILIAITVLLTSVSPLLARGHSYSYHRSYSYHPRSTRSYARSSGYYTNVSNHRVRRPAFASSRPHGASAHCSDGSWSFSEHARGTCSHHGGVASW